VKRSVNLRAIKTDLESLAVFRFDNAPPWLYLLSHFPANGEPGTEEWLDAIRERRNF
jgi:hypothetical protein